MGESFIARNDARAGEVLAFIAAAAAEGDEAVVPAACLPVLTDAARCRPDARGVFVFRRPSGRIAVCGWGERAAAVVMLALFAPVLLVVALLVRMFDGPPVLFRQERYGCHGAPFIVLKFRTMMRRSERLHAKLQRKLGMAGRLFKLERDPRVTRLGAVLRRTFIDELPQLVNVARGEMRFFGPRPLPASDRGHYTQPCHALRLEGMPGMTGLWQVSGRNRLTFDEMCLLDVYYLCNRSLRFDLWLAVRTAGVVFEQAGLKRKPQNRGEGDRGTEDARGDRGQADCGPHPAGERRDR
jgi:lipopolysaccharide/colanic/teichoic acid biosynthesis glycosyltransferase